MTLLKFVSIHYALASRLLFINILLWFAILPNPSLSTIALLSIFMIIILFLLLHYYRIPPVNNSILERVLSGSDQIHLIAHRGGSHEAPENTLLSFKLAKENGADGVEFDLEFTQDGEAVLFHDDTLERTTEGNGKIHDCDFKALRTLNAAHTHHLTTCYNKEEVPTLEEALKLCLDLDLKIFIDVKRDHPKVVPLLVSMFEKYPDLYNNAIVCSFYPVFLYKFRQANKDVVTALTWRPDVLTWKSDAKTELRNKELWKQLVAPVADQLLEWSLHTWVWYVTGVSVFLVSKSVVSQSYYNRWMSRGLRVILWTVNSPVEKDFFTRCLKCSILTDCVTNVECGDACVHHKAKH